ncbi:MAG: hypothetical protein A2V70_08540 [Planctomycetes bacterium RBG_13_63_9]|nr:MAG: hypothetical protein A2V70_08540 [Planctomycetes bacterium RBG_13_63_9]
MTIEVWDQAMTTLLGSTMTAADGSYSLNVNLGAGAYVIVEAVDELAELGLLDGKETAGNLGGTVDNGQDSNQIGISVSDPPQTADAVDYLFAEIRSSDVFGRVWRDFNNDGEINFDEEDVNDVEVELTGTDDRGNSVSLTGMTADNLGFGFTNLRPGTYAITETQPVDLDDGQEVLGEVTDLGVPTAVADPGMIDGNDRFSGIELVPGALADRYNFGELPQAGGEMPCGSTASIGFWHNWIGQSLIRHLSDYAAAHGGSATQLGDWLAATFPNMYGPGAEYDAARGWDWDMNLAGKSDCYVAWTFRYLHQRNRKTMVENGGVPKVDAQVMALALATFATSENLAGTIAQCYWFNTSADGIAYTTYNVLDVLTVEEAADLGLSQANGNMDADGNVTIIDILHSTNDMATLGLLYDSDDTAEGDGDGEIDNYEKQLRKLANELYRVINGRRWWW